MLTFDVERLLTEVPVQSCKTVATILALAGAAFGPRAFAQFETRANLDVPTAGPESVLVGDFNGDGILDAATVGNLSSSGKVQVLLGNGDGTFRLGTSYSFGFNPYYGAVASLRGNGVTDVVVADLGSDNVYVLLGNGDGTFQPPVAYTTTAKPLMVVIGNFIDDGNLDVATVEITSTQGVVCDCVEVLPGNGDGTFGAPITTPVPYNITGVSIAAGNFNDNGKLDIAVGGFAGFAKQVDILLGNGDGTFTPDGYYSLTGSPSAIATGYFTPNKKQLDLAPSNIGVGVMLGNGNGTFQEPTYYAGGLSSWVIALDVNGDGKIDLVTSDAGSPPDYPPGVTVFNGNGNGTFETGVFYPVEGKNGEGGDFVAAGDFNGDHKPDLLVVNAVNGYITTLLNTGVVSFSPTTPLNFRDQSIGTTSKAQTVTLTNTGTTELKIKSMKASAEFAVTSTCGSAVAAGANCTISATFSPTKEGSVQGAISIIDSASSKPQVIELLGTGT
jgi:hypothetical protein